MNRAIEAFLAAAPSRLNLAAKAAIMSTDGRIVDITAPAAAPSMAQSIRSVREFFGARWSDGDVAVLNDPDRGATHVCQLTAVAAIYKSGAIAGWAAMRSNALDFGGWHPGGYSPQAVDRWAEGARFEPAKLMLAGKVRREVLDLLSLNSRTPQATRRLALRLAEQALNLGTAADLAESAARYAAELSEIRRRFASLARRTEQSSADIAAPHGWPSPGAIAVEATGTGDTLKITVAAPTRSARPLNLCQATARDIVTAAVAASLRFSKLRTGALADALQVHIPESMAAARLPACVGMGRETTGAALFRACSEALAALDGRPKSDETAKRWLDEEVIGEMDWTSGRLGAEAVAAVLATEREAVQ